MATSLKVNACDNELFIVATTASGASEICHISPGRDDPANYAVDLNAILPPGDYDLILIGVNWGGPATFAVTVGTTPYAYSDPKAPIGAVWKQTIPVTI